MTIKRNTYFLILNSSRKNHKLKMIKNLKYSNLLNQILRIFMKHFKNGLKRENLLDDLFIINLINKTIILDI